MECEKIVLAPILYGGSAFQISRSGASLQGRPHATRDQQASALAEQRLLFRGQILEDGDSLPVANTQFALHHRQMPYDWKTCDAMSSLTKRSAQAACRPKNLVAIVGKSPTKCIQKGLG